MIKGTSILRESNEKKVLRLLREKKATTRQDLVQQTNLGKNTISLIIDKLINEGTVQETGAVNERRAGRPKMVIELVPSAIKIIGVNFEKNCIRIGLFDYRLQEIQSKTFYNVTTEETDKVVQFLKEKITSLVADFPEVIGVGLSVPGIVDSDSGTVKLSSRLGWMDFELGQAIQKFFSGIICVINMVKALSLINSISDLSSVYYIRIREGVGGAFIQNGEIAYGNSWLAGEVGQIPTHTEHGEEVRVEQLLNENIVYSELRQKNREEVMENKGKIVGWIISLIILLCNPTTIIVDAFYCKEKMFRKNVNDYLSINIENLMLKGTNVFLTYVESKFPEYGAVFSVISKYEKINL